METYTRNEIQRIATEKAIEILTHEKDMILNNTSYGFSKGECIVGLANGYNSFYNTKEILIVLERQGLWHENKINLSVYEKINGEMELIEIIEKFYGIRDKNGDDLYLTDEEAYKRHQQRQLNKYSEKDNHMNIKMNTSLNKKLKDRIQRDTGKKIKKQDFLVRKHDKGYAIQYDYRNIRKTLYI